MRKLSITKKGKVFNPDGRKAINCPHKTMTIKRPCTVDCAWFNIEGSRIRCGEFTLGILRADYR